MYLLMIDVRAILVCGVAMLVSSGAGGVGVSPEDEAVSGYLEEHGFDELLEVQLFDRLRAEGDSIERVRLAERLGSVYLTSLGLEGLSEDERRGVLVKGRVLVGMVQGDALLELRLTLLIEQYKEFEQAADLDRIGLLDDETKALALESMRAIGPVFGRIAVLANGQVEVFDRNASRTVSDQRDAFEKKLASARSVRSRAHFFLGWSGYSEAVLSGRAVGGDVVRGFGWVLGFGGKMPVLDRVDGDLLEYDHVARAMIGVALCKMQNGDLREARAWLSAVEDSTEAPEFAVNFARQRQLEVMLLERDWIGCERRALFLGRVSSESLLGVAQARLLVMRSLSAIGSRDVGRGGTEGIQEVARLGLDRLIDLGEIGHVLDLRERFGTLPMLRAGFVSLYVQGLAELADGERRGDAAGFTQAAVKFNQALQAGDVDQYGTHVGDAVLKLAYCELRSGRAGEASGALDRFASLLVTDQQVEESEWMQILAHDAAVAGGQEQLGEKLRGLIGAYIRAHPSSERGNKLIVRYAMTAYLGAEDAVGALVIDDPADPLAVPARRKLIQLLYKNPDLVDGGDERLFEVLVGHARWLWDSEPGEIVNVRDGRERLAVCRIVLGAGLGVDMVDLGFLKRVIVRGEAIVEAFPVLGDSSSELAFRRVQVLLLGGEIERAGEMVLVGGVLDEPVRSSALLMVYGKASERFRERASVPSGQAVIRYGRGVLDGTGGSGLDGGMSIVAEGMARAAEYLAGELGDGTMLEYAGALSLRVFLEGVPSKGGLVRTAVLVEGQGHGDVALECWLRLVGQVHESKELWARARYESLRLLMATDEARGREVYGQYVALHPGGLAEPWGSRIAGLFERVGP